VKVAAIVGVKDERDLIKPCLERLWSVGVGPILVLDDQSTDGTRDVIERLSARSPAPLVRTTFAHDFGQNLRLDSDVFAPFMQQHSPDWLLFIDADEFLICVNNDLRAILTKSDAPVLSIERFNVPLTRDPFIPASGTNSGDFLGVSLIASQEVLNRTLLEETPGRRWIMHRILPKLVCRPEKVAHLGLGWHSASNSRGQVIPVNAAKGIVIVHLPMTTPERFVGKVDNAREFFRRWADHYPGEAAWHWKRWVDLADRGLLDAEFEAQRMDEATVQRLSDLGVIERASAVLEKSRRSDALS